MKKILTILLLSLVVVLSGCANAENVEPHDEDNDPTFTEDSYLFFDWDTLTFTDTHKSDILYASGLASIDFNLLQERIDNDVTEEEKETYNKAIIVTESLGGTDFNYRSADTYTTAEIQEYALEAGTDLTVTDVVAYQYFTSAVTTSKTDAPEGSTYINKIDYVEYRLNRKLSSTEVGALELLQQKYSELYRQTQQVFDFENKNVTEFLTLLETEIGFEPDTFERNMIQTGFSIVKELHTG